MSASLQRALDTSRAVMADVMIALASGDEQLVDSQLERLDKAQARVLEALRAFSVELDDYTELVESFQGLR